MRASSFGLTGPALTGEFPQSIIEILSGSPLFVIGIGGAVFILALVLLILMRRRRRRAPAGIPTPEPVTEEKMLESLNLDDLVAMGTDLYQTLGHSVRDVTQPSRDVADLIIDSKDGQRWIARCLAKPTINSQEVASFRRAIRKAGIPQSALITSGSFTTEALDEAARGDIHTLEVPQLIGYLSRAKQKPQ